MKVAVLFSRAEIVRCKQENPSYSSRETVSTDIIRRCCASMHSRGSLVSENAKEAFGKVLEACCGLPIALAVVGGTIRTFAQMRCKGNSELAWYECRSAWHSFDGEDMMKQRLISLKVLDVDGNECVYHKQYEAVCIHREAQYVSMDFLARLWDVTVTGAKEMVYKLERLLIVWVVTDGRDDHCKTRVGLHDIFARYSKTIS